jgi:deazaflavin-dependent oxidoreductase (nitroreductase family)
MTWPEKEILDSAEPWVAEHIREYLDSDGERGHSFHGFPSLLLTTRGRRTAALRRTALIYGTQGDQYLLVASNGGAAQHPAWYLNVLADPHVCLQIRADRFAACARTAVAGERPGLWQLMTDLFPRYLTYQAQVEREIPVVVVDRTG